MEQRKKESGIRLEDVAAGYGRKSLLNHISLHVSPGNVLTLIGPNGAGKSTILKTVTRQLAELGGTIFLEGTSMSRMREEEVARTLAMVMTERLHPEFMTCREVVATGRYPYTGRLGILSAEDWKLVDDAMQLVHARDTADRNFSQISDGQRQRVMLARAICQEPRILILDEPTSYLDMRYKIDILSSIRRLAAERNMAVVMSLHELDLALKVSDVIACVEGDHIGKTGTPEEVFSGDYIQKLYGVDAECFDPRTGAVYLRGNKSRPKIFVIGGAGSGIPVYHALQRKNVPFAAGILMENDVEYQDACAAASRVVSVKPFFPVTEEEIARIIERWTGIPTARLMEGERDKLLHLEDTLHKRVIGQDEAVRVVAEAIQRSRAGIQDPNRPLGSFLFLGPTGVGKTELAKTLAEALFDDEKNLVRIDMSEYMEKFSVSRLIGAPPGYVGYEEGGQLTEAVRRRPYSVILFDEIEKAHPDVFNILLQVLDDGRITDSQGRTVDFKNTIIILTSNLGSQAILDGITPAGEISEEAKNEVQTLLRRSFRPEFLNRLDEIVFYKPLSKENITGIIDLQIAALNKRLADKQLTCELTPAAKTFVIDAAYDPQFGARPLRRYLQHTVETLLAQRILRGDVLPGQTLVCDVQNGELVITAK